ncbi:MAG: MFS transporter [Candidatus Bathyarchaeia archaeon]
MEEPLEESEEEPIEVSRALLATGVSQMFSDSLANRFLNLLAVAVGATVKQMGFLTAAKSISSNILQLLWGRMADRYGKKLFIAAGRILNTFVLVGVILIPAPEWLIPLIILFSVFYSMAFPSWKSLLGDYASESARGEMIGKINSVSMVGSFAGMLIALLLSLGQVGESTRESYLMVMGLAALMSLVSGVAVLFVEERPPQGVGGGFRMRSVLRDPRLRKYLLLNTVYGLVMSLAWPLFPFVISEKLRMRVWQIATFSVLGSLSNLASQRYMGRLMDRVGRRPVIVFSRVIMAVSPIAYALAPNWIYIVLSEFIMGIGMGAWGSSESTYTIDLAPRDLRGTYLAASTTAFGLASFAGSLVGGYMVENILMTNGGFSGINMGLIISGILRAVFGLLYISVYESKE